MYHALKCGCGSVFKTWRRVHSQRCFVKNARKMSVERNTHTKRMQLRQHFLGRQMPWALSEIERQCVRFGVERSRLGRESVCSVGSVTSHRHKPECDVTSTQTRTRGGNIGTHCVTAGMEALTHRIEYCLFRAEICSSDFWTLIVNNNGAGCQKLMLPHLLGVRELHVQVSADLDAHVVLGDGRLGSDDDVPLPHVNLRDRTKSSNSGCKNSKHESHQASDRPEGTSTGTGRKRYRSCCEVPLLHLSRRKTW